MKDSQFAAFRLGYRDSARLVRWGFRPDSLTPRTAETIRPSLAEGVATTSAYLNGWDDGVRGDRFRLDAIADCEEQGLRF